MSTFFDLIPDEIMSQILLYLDIDDINPSSHNFSVGNIIKSKLFWIQKLTYDGMELYIPFLSNDNYVGAYYRFESTDRRVRYFMQSLRYPYAKMNLFIPDDAELTDLVNTFTIEKLSKLEKLNFYPYKGKHILIEYFKGKYYYYVTQVSFNEKNYLKAKDLKILLIKLVLADINLDALPDSEEMLSDSSEY